MVVRVDGTATSLHGVKPCLPLIRSALSPDALLLEVADDGVGIPAEVDFTHPTSMGLQVVQSLTSQLGDTFDVDRTAGTKIMIAFPRPN